MSIRVSLTGLLALVLALGADQGGRADPPAADDKPRVSIKDERQAARRLREKGADVGEPNEDDHYEVVALKGDVKADDFHELQKLPHVHTLTVRGGRGGLDPEAITDEAFASVGGLTKLEKLDARGLRIGDAACKHIARASALRELKLAGARITDEGVKALKALARLESLDLSGTAVSGAGLAELAALKNLKALDLRGVRLRTGDLKGIGRLVSLRVLRLPAVEGEKGAPAHPVYETPGTDDVLRPDGGNGDLGPREERYKPLRYESIDYADGLKHLAGLVNLEGAAMTNAFTEAAPGRKWNFGNWDEQPLAAVGDDELLANRFDKKTTSEMLRLMGVVDKEPTGALTLKPVAGDTRTIRESSPGLYFFLRRPSGALLEHIKDYRGVKSLDLSRFMLVDDDLKYLAGFTKLERLDLSGSPISGKGLAHLKELPALKYLNLRGTRVGDGDLEALGQMKGLKDVVLSQSRVTRDGVDKLQDGNKVRVVFDPEQKRPWWCNVNWRLELERATR